MVQLLKLNFDNREVNTGHFIVETGWLAVVSALLRHPVPVVKRLWGSFFDSVETLQAPLGVAILRSIGVLLPLQGTWACVSLLQTFYVLALSKGYEQVFFTTDEMNNVFAQRFLKVAVIGRLPSFSKMGSVGHG